MKQQYTAQIGYWLKVVALGVVLGFGIQFAQAWTNPGGPAPTGNLAGPINTGIIDQVKNAGLGLVGNLVVGSAVAPRSICLNGTCIGAWPAGVPLSNMIKNGAGCPCAKSPWTCPSGTYPSGTSVEKNDGAGYKWTVTCFDGLEVQTTAKVYVPSGNDGGL